MTPDVGLLAALAGFLGKVPEAGTGLAALLDLARSEIDALAPGTATALALPHAAPPRLVIAVVESRPGPFRPGQVLVDAAHPAFGATTRLDPVQLVPGAPGAEPLPELAAAGVRSLLLVPLRAEGATFGVWVLAGTSPAAFPAPVVEALRGFSGALALAVHRTLCEQEAGERARALAQSEKLAAMGRLVAGVAHELGGPLQAIISLAEVLIRDPEREDRQEAAHRILRSALRCRGLAQDLLSFARKQPHRLVPTKVEEALMDALELDRFSDVGEVQVQIDGPTAMPQVLADPQRLSQAILNLITNARHATAGAGRPGLVRVTLEAVPARRTRLDLPPEATVVRLAVVDQGPGVPAEVRPRLFEPFMTTKPDGTGLGLNISRSLVEEIGGRLYLDEAHGPGARFVLEIPALYGEAPRNEAADPGALRGGCTILLIDDDREVLETYEVILALDQHQVRSCDRALKALQVLKEESFDAIVCDVRLPDLMARDFLSQLQRARPEMAARVIFATGDVVSDDTRQFLRSIPNPALIKPFQIDDLQRAIALIVQQTSEQRRG